ncbi:S8 family peptidase [Natronorubrum daqingense]|uniref:Peptidase S8/S53 subtilisin kexin sedolisin n=1 Tax=Natronorubrum daqingense TaxID=588898 RepID=A0A1N7CDS2_9EURY|nr:S8 family serine peptidase [Natronorubrum daqingense]APX96855.1 peptidase S8/S53 subtilisin kexin sedolisin [Natronorubrum daqingense]SIR61739.1 serine protease AprX [Natronorubrum daqingense]
MQPDDSTNRRTRRTVLTGIGTGVTGSVALSATGTALDLGDALEGLTAVGDTLVDDDLDLGSEILQEVLVVFESNDDIVRLEALDVELSIGFDVLPIAYAELPGSLIELVAEWDEVRYVSSNYELEYHNDDARSDTNADAVQVGDGLETGYTGENVHVAVIDSGIDGAHSDLEADLEANYRYIGIPEVQDEPLWWEELGSLDTDRSGHGTHCAGSVGATGGKSDGEYAGMAPDADLTVYSVGLAGLLMVFVVAAYDDLLSRQRDGEHDIQVVSNSYGTVEDDRPFVPDDPMNVATWHAHDAGILPVFSAGNDGPDHGTLSQFAKAPHVLGVGATDDEEAVADFSSRGRPQDGSFDEDNHDRELAYENLTQHFDDVPEDEIDGPLGLYRTGVTAKGEDVVSTLNPVDPLNIVEPNEELYYGPMSGTSMSCPVTAGCAALVYDAAIEHGDEPPDPMDVLVTLEATADEQRHESYTAESVGAGYVDALAALEHAESGTFATFDDIDIAPSSDAE